MASVKNSFSNGIGYIKYEINQLKEQKAELQEFIGYHEGNNTSIAKIRVFRAKADIESIDCDIYDLNQELLFYKDYFRYSQEEIDNIKPATEQSLEKYWKQIIKERDTDDWTQADHDALMQRVYEYDLSLGRIVA